METPRVVIAIYDSTTARCLKPIGKDLSERVDVEYLLLDELLPRSTMGSEISEAEFLPCRRASNYLNSDWLQGLNEVERAHPVRAVIVQRLLEDNISPELTYDISGYLDDAEPDVFVCGQDLLPFLKHVIKWSHTDDFESVVVQHGINRPDLENPSSLPGVPDLLSPDRTPRYWPIEYLKRRLGFNYGAFLFCNPYVDELYTLGEFFTNLVSDLRSDYPCFGKTDVVTAGSTEYNPTAVEAYEGDVSSAVFLSQWQYEHNIWDAEQQSYITDRLTAVEQASDISITVRPHPKDSTAKMEQFFSEFEISQEAGLHEDIERHDAVLTVDSTALYAGAIAGNACGVIQTPWNEITLKPFTHEHIVQVTPSANDVASEAAERSRETQTDYLRECCFVPALENKCPYDSPVDLVSSRIEALCTE